MRRAAAILAWAAGVAWAAEARPFPGLPAFAGGRGTNETVVMGVKMPPRFTAEQWAEREAMRARQIAETEAFDARVEEGWRAGLTERQRWALREQSATNELMRVAAEAARRRRRAEARAFVLERGKWTAAEFEDRRRKVTEFREGLTWEGERVVRLETIRAERGRVKLDVLVTLDAKGRERRRRIDFAAIAKMAEGGE